MIVLWLALVARADCPEEVGPDALVQRAEAALDAYRSADIAGGREQVQAAEELLGCVDAPLSGSHAATLHLAEALTAEHAGDHRGAVAATAAARALDAELVGAAGFAALDEEAQALPPAALTEFSTSLAAEIYVDGGTQAARRVGRPFVVQVFDPNGGVVGAAWIAAGERVPGWVASPPVVCVDQVPVDDLVLEVGRAEAAYAALDVPGFEDALHAIAVGLPCANGVVLQGQAAAIHRLEGLRQFVHGNASQAIRAFQEAHALDPGYTPPTSTVPPGSTLEALWERARTQPGSPWVAADVPDGVALLVDGLPSRSRPAALPSIVQVATPSGWVLWTRFVPPGGTIPDLEPFAARAAAMEREQLPPALALYRDAEVRRKRMNRRTGLILASAGSLSAAAGAYLANTVLVSEYENPRTVYDRRPALRRDANIAAGAGTVLFATGIGFGVGAVFVR